MRIRRPRPATGAARTRLLLESLETREVPAITIQLDYSYDSNGFFNDPTRRAVLEQVVSEVASHLDASLPALTPSGGNTWTASFFNPATGQETRINGRTVAADTIVIYAGGRDLTGAEAGVGGYGGYGASGSQDWLNAVGSRGPGFTLWGGSLAFDTHGTDWFFGTSTAGMGPNQVDFYSVATHELGHALGIGTAPGWFNRVSGGAFTGSTAQSIYGGPVPLAGNAHWADGITVDGRPVSLDPTSVLGGRVGLSPLDYAALRDIGWSVSGVAGVPTDAVPPPPAPPPPPASSSFGPVPLGTPLLASSASSGTTRPVVLTGPTDGSAQAFALRADGQLAAAGPAVQPFPGYAGVIRSTAADFNGDGSPDFVFATGSGTAATVRVIDGKSGSDIVGPTTVLGGFTGGVFVAAGDVDRDGKAELAVSADAGGSTRVSVYKVANGGLTTLADFLAFDSPLFRGGSRIAMGDLDRDGAADLVVGAGTGGGPRVSVYDGDFLTSGKLVRLMPDFFALDSQMRSGVYVSVADFNGDGFADIAYSTGDTGGPRVRVVSGLALVANPGKDVAALPALADFFAWDANDRKGIRIAARDLDGDGRADLIAASGNKSNATVRVIPLSQMTVPATSLQNPLTSPLTIDGVYVG